MSCVSFLEQFLCSRKIQKAYYCPRCWIENWIHCQSYWHPLIMCTLIMIVSLFWICFTFTDAFSAASKPGGPNPPHISNEYQVTVTCPTATAHCPFFTIFTVITVTMLMSSSTELLSARPPGGYWGVGGETAGPKHCGVPAGRREAGPGRDTTEQLIPGEGEGREDGGRVDQGWE